MGPRIRLSVCQVDALSRFTGDHDVVLLEDCGDGDRVRVFGQDDSYLSTIGAAGGETPEDDKFLIDALCRAHAPTMYDGLTWDSLGGEARAHLRLDVEQAVKQIERMGGTVTVGRREVV